MLYLCQPQSMNMNVLFPRHEIKGNLYLRSLLETNLIWFQQAVIHLLVNNFGGSHHKLISFSSPKMIDYFKNMCAEEKHEQQIAYTYMFSINMVICKVPRPLTTNVSAVSPSSTFIAKLRSSSR